MQQNQLPTKLQPQEPAKYWRSTNIGPHKYELFHSIAKISIFFSKVQVNFEEEAWETVWSEVGVGVGEGRILWLIWSEWVRIKD